MTQIFCFQQEDINYFINTVLGDLDTKYVGGYLSPEQFEVFETFCSGSHLRGSFQEALEWIKNHQKELDQEATENQKFYGFYDLPMGYCKFFGKVASETDFLFCYETTSGTILMRGSDPSVKHMVLLPKKRCEGFHASILKMLAEGMSEEDIDRELNPHRYTPRKRSPEHKEPRKSKFA